jgi:hypothetical protein
MSQWKERVGWTNQIDGPVRAEGTELRAMQRLGMLEASNYAAFPPYWWSTCNFCSSGLIVAEFEGDVVVCDMELLTTLPYFCCRITSTEIEAATFLTPSR